MLPEAAVLFRALLWNAGTEAGARITFQQLVTDLVLLQFPEADEVGGGGGSDWGIDTYVGRLNTSIVVWQSKYFLSWNGKNHRGNVLSSFAQLMAKARGKGFTVSEWTLCLPCVLPPEERQWFDTWAGEQERRHGLAVALWTGVRLRELLMRDDAAPLRRQYFTLGESQSAADRRVGKVRDADPRRLGVHAAITLPTPAAELPLYVARDLDRHLLACLAEGARRGCFVLLVGGSSVGKSRTLYEAIREVVPDWSLLRPEPGDDLRAVLSPPPPRTVVWLDEFQRFLTEPERLTSSVVRSALDAGAIVVATLWPNEYHSKTRETAADSDAGAGPGSELFKLAEIIEVADRFTETEQQAAAGLAERDPRIQIALDTPDYGVTQILAAAPQLIRAWRQAPDGYSRALITAAVDARRLGWLSPIPRSLLADLVPAYLSLRDRAEAPHTWLDQSLAYATAVLCGAASVLCPVAERMNEVIGYTLADYVLQHGRRTRRSERLPVGAWAILTSHVQDRRDAERLADSAYARGFYRQAEPLYQRALASARAWTPAADLLAGIYERQGRIEEAATLAASISSWRAQCAISEILERDGQPQRAIALLEESDLENQYVAWRLAEVYAGVGNIQEALRLLEPVTTDFDDDPDMVVDTLRADLLVQTGRIDELRARALDTKFEDWCAAERLVRYYRENNMYAQAFDVFAELQRDSQDWADELVKTLVAAGRIDELVAWRTYEQLVDPEFEELFWNASPELIAALLAENGRADALRQCADIEDTAASIGLAAAGQNEDLHRQATSGDQAALRQYSQTLAERGDPAAALALYAEQNGSDPWHRAELLARTGAVEEALTLLKSSETPIANELRWVHGDRDSRIVEFAARHGQLDEIRKRVNDGDWFAEDILTKTLAAQGKVDELRIEADAGATMAVERLAEALTRQGRTTEAEHLHRFGLDSDDPSRFIAYPIGGNDK